MPAEFMSIGELANRTGVPVSTIRFYERLGLIAPEGRTGGNYRYFGDAAVDRLGFIRAAQASGLSLDDVSTLCRFDDGTTRPCREVQALIEQRLTEIAGQMKHLRHVQHVLSGYREACRRTRKNRPCPVLSNLHKPAES